MSARCDECGAPSSTGAVRCARCGADMPEEAPTLRYDHPACLRGWTVLRRATVAYAVAQLALAALGDAPHRGTRLVTLIPFVAVPLGLARARAGAWLSPWAALMCAGTLLALGLLLTGAVATSGLQALTLGTSVAWVTAAVYAAWQVRDGALRGAATAAASSRAGHDTPTKRPVD
ncbi:MAG: hypothetical protein U0325_07025 [Polyangiales bacterium]